LITNRELRVPRAPDIRNRLAALGVQISSEQAEQVRTYISILLLWNQKLALTSVTHPDEIISRHFFESMFAAQFGDFSKGRLADVGSGAGFPGLALKIIRPDLEITLIEANSRKCTFLKEVIRALGLTRCSVLNSRLESAPPSAQAMDFITSRAFGQFDQLLNWARESLVIGGQIVLWVGTRCSGRIASRSDWSWREPVLIPGSARRVLLFGKPR
jgi:16S rRNA (guanine527-N7)-methyltransferase